MKKRESILSKFRKMDIFSWIMYLIVWCWVISVIAVVCFAMLNSFKARNDIFSNGVFTLPSNDKPSWGWHFEYYLNIFRPFQKGVTDNPMKNLEQWNYFYVSVGSKKIYLYEMLFNSLAFTFFMTLFVVATEILVAYCCAKYTFPLKNLYYAVGVIVMLIPIVGSLASELRFAEWFNFNNNLIGVCIMKCKYPGLYFLVFYASFSGVSSTYMEAAELDGAGHWQILLQIMLPLIQATTSAIFILMFIQNWNDYYTPMIFLRMKPVISLALYNLSFNNTGYYHESLHLAASICTAIPLVILFMIFRNKIMGNVSMGGIKG